MHSESPSSVLDTLHRPLHDLRISVTDRCNFRCTYCMPKEVFGPNHHFLARSELLSFEEIHRLASVFCSLGVRKIRLTGGEPLLRRHLERLVAMLAELPAEITLTTNGTLLAQKATALKAAGLDRVTVSLDALDDATFQRMNDVGAPVGTVLNAIDAAADAGLGPIKINMVVQRSVNLHSVLPMARHFKGSGHIVRFIEFMDVGTTNGWRMDDVAPSREIVELIGRELPLEPVDPNYTGEVAERWRYRDGDGEIGVISSVTQAFCQDCTRARLSTDGQLFTCLFASRGNDLRTALRGGAGDAELAEMIRVIWNKRNDRYSELRSAAVPLAQKIEMSYIGG